MLTHSLEGSPDELKVAAYIQFLASQQRCRFSACLLLFPLLFT